MDGFHVQRCHGMYPTKLTILVVITNATVSMSKQCVIQTWHFFMLQLLHLERRMISVLTDGALDCMPGLRLFQNSNSSLLTMHTHYQDVS